jgi:hypothetical protein
VATRAIKTGKIRGGEISLVMAMASTGPFAENCVTLNELLAILN